MQKKYLFVMVFILALAGGLLTILLLNRPDKEPVSVTVGGGGSVNIALLHIALDRGFFRDEGLDLTFKLYDSAHLAFHDMLEGGVDLALSAETPVVFKAFEREDFSILSSIFSSYNDPKLLCLKSSGIKSPVDLVGKRLGTTKRGQSAHYFLYLFMTKYGLDSDKLNLIFTGPDELTELLKRGELDGVSLFEPYVSRTAAELGDDALVFSEPELYYKYVLLTGRNDFIKQNGLLVEGVLRGLLRAEEFALKNREQAVEIVGRRCSIEQDAVVELLGETNLEVLLDQTLLLTLEEESRWNSKTTGEHMGRELPDFLTLIDREPLKRVKPGAVVVY